MLKSSNIPLVFYKYAGQNLKKWEYAKGEEIKHKYYGVGIIGEAYLSNGSVYVNISFEKLPEEERGKIFNLQAFQMEIFTDISIPTEINEEFTLFYRDMEKKLQQEEQRKKEELNQKEKEEKSKQEFKELRVKYNISKKEELSPDTLLFPILLKLDAGETFEEDEIEWLQSNREYKVLAHYYSKRYDITGDGWNLIHSSSNWRKSESPHNAIATIDGVIDQVFMLNKKLYSAYLVTRGGAFRDINELPVAKRCAEKAREESPNSYYPYNLLGAICYQEGLPEEGDKYFSIAMKLGSPLRNSDYEIAGALKRAGINEKMKIKEYLLKKDSEKYNWVKKHIKE